MLAKIVEGLPWYKKIEVLRAIKGWSQKEAAEKCGVGQRVYWNWESGNSIPIKKNRERLAKVYDTQEDDIFCELYRGDRFENGR